MKRCLEVAQKVVNRNEFFSSDIWNSFKKNLDMPLYSARTGYSRVIIQNGALLVTIHILATFVGQNLHVFLRRDLRENNQGNYLLGLKNIIPARNSPSSSYMSRSEN